MSKRDLAEIIVSYKADGTMRPLMVILEDGRRLVVDKVLTVEKAGPLRCLDQVAEFCIFFNEKKIYCINRTITMFGDYKFSVLIIAIWIIIIFTI